MEDAMNDLPGYAGSARYIPGDSSMHRLNPVAKFMGAVLLGFACLCANNVFLLACLVVVVMVSVGSCGAMRPSLGLMKRMLPFALAFGVAVLFASPLLGPLTSALVVPVGELPTSGLFTLPWGPVGVGSVVLAVSAFVRLEIALVPMVAALCTTRVFDLAASMTAVLGTPFDRALDRSARWLEAPRRAASMVDVAAKWDARGIGSTAEKVVLPARTTIFGTDSISQRGAHGGAADGADGAARSLEDARRLEEAIQPYAEDLMDRTLRTASIAAELRGAGLRTRRSSYKKRGFTGVDVLYVLIMLALVASAILLSLV